MYKKIALEEAKLKFLKQAGIGRFGKAEEIADLAGGALDDWDCASNGWRRSEVGLTG
jgi:hypothetical protein